MFIYIRYLIVYLGSVLVKDFWTPPPPLSKVNASNTAFWSNCWGTHQMVRSLTQLSPRLLLSYNRTIYQTKWDISANIIKLCRNVSAHKPGMNCYRNMSPDKTSFTNHLLIRYPHEEIIVRCQTSILNLVVVL